jgi:23S rRNA pseudouridine955/2504/2580 synthase/23S rRNA pseudouridine1911/1915/1917 synthase
MPEWIIPGEEGGKKLVTFLSERLAGKYSARHLKRLIEQNSCQLNGRTERFASTPLVKGDHIILALSETKSSLANLEPKRILYEDDALLIYNKPAGINSDEKGILKLFNSYYPYLQLIHRLDRDTTGALLLAKSPSVFNQMVHIFRQLKVEKQYIALVDGIVEPSKGSIDNYLGKKHVYEGQTIWGEVNKDRGVHAHTDWVKVAMGKSSTLLLCFPQTGRTHQIRVHLSEMGHPILGDFQYCKRFQCPYRPNRYLLHAQKITFSHPLTGKRIEVEAPLPQDFKEALQALQISMK